MFVVVAELRDDRLYIPTVEELLAQLVEVVVQRERLQVVEVGDDERSEGLVI